MLGYKVKSNGFARPDEESFIDKVHKGYLRNTTIADRAGSPRV